MNPPRSVRGIDRVVGEMLLAVPDVDEFLHDLESISTYIEKDLNDLQMARQAVRLAELSLRANVELLVDRLRRGRQDWRGRKDEIEAGAADVAAVVPQLGFSIVVPLHRDAGGSVA